MNEFRMLHVTNEFGVIEVLGNEPLDWSWVGNNRDRQALYNKLLQGGWDIQHRPSETQLMVRRINS